MLRHETLRPPLPALLALRTSRSSTGRSRRGSSQVTTFHDRMVELNQQINWVPEHVKHGSFGKWLENARDWSISRNRFWGSPIPVWRSDDPDYPRIDVYGSHRRARARLRRDGRPTCTGRAIDELVAAEPRRPDRAVDDAARPRGARLLVRVGLDAVRPGALPVREPRVVRVALSRATSSSSTSARPAAGSTRCTCWPRRCSTARRSATASATASCSATTARRCRRACATTPTRWRCSTRTAPTRCGGTCCRRRSCAAATSRSPRPGMRDTVRQVLLPIWNAWYFLTLYANAAGVHGSARRRRAPISTNVLDRYILAKTRELVDDVTAAMDAYDLFGACATVRPFLDALTNWYIRRSRERFWAGDHDAIDTLHTVLDVLVRVAAPLLPFVTEEIYRGLHGGATQRVSVHLTDWPDADDLPADDDAGARRWTRCATCARRRCRCARPTAAGCASRSPTLTVAAPDAERAGAVRRPHRRRGQRPRGRAHRRRRVGGHAAVLQVVPRRSARASAPTPSTSSGPCARATGRATATPSSPAGTPRAGEYTLRLVADGDGRQRRARRRRRRGRARRRPHPRARGRGPGPRPRPLVQQAGATPTRVTDRIDLRIVADAGHGSAPSSAPTRR